jgi:antitoxin component YwqK of YwqJK toxin-antitoxin module
MKSQIITILVFFSSLFGFSQIGPNDDAVFLDSLNNIGTEENYKFIRVIKDFAEEKELYDVAFYSRSGKIERRAQTTNKFFMAFEGPCVYYYENGKRKKMETYSDKKINGKQYEWYENGSIKLESEVVHDKKTNNSTTKIIHYWNANNEQKVIDGEGEYEEIEVVPNSNIGEFTVKSNGKIKNYSKDGTWTGESKNPKFRYIEQFENGKLISGKRIDSTGVTISYNEVFQRPKPKKGMDDFYRFVARNFNTPLVQGIKGVIYATFIVDKDGKVADIKIIRDLGYGTGAEAIRVIRKFDQWVPGLFKGEPVRVMYSLPITIQSSY